jgi:hypothetical protein
MTSAPGVVLAAVIAARSEPVPLSARLVTVKVLSKVRSSKVSRVRRVAGPWAGLVGRKCPGLVEPLLAGACPLSFTLS